MIDDTVGWFDCDGEGRGLPILSGVRVLGEESRGFTDGLLVKQESGNFKLSLFTSRKPMSHKRFDYTFSAVGDLAVQTTTDAKSGKRTVSAILVDSEPIKPTDRFWTSLYARFGITRSIFKYFSHESVFRRISQAESQDRMRLCIERNSDTGVSRLLAVSNPTKPIVRHDDLMETLGRYEGSDVRYSNGVVESSHIPRAGANSFEISGDAFSNRFVMSTPIDGYGLPNIYLSLLRQICSNGMVGCRR